MADFKSSLQKLGDSNYAVWKFRMELVLIQEGLQTVVNEAKPEPADATWTTKDAKARAIIGLSIDDSQLCHVIRAETAKDMWDCLKKYHERSSLSSKVHVLRKLCSQRLLEGGSMSDHLNEVTALTNKLTAMGEELKEHLVVAMLFSSLPESYGSLVTALESRPEEDLSLEFVKGKLLDEWRRREERQAAEKVLRTGGETTGTSSARSKVTCHYCNKEGHYRRDCKKLAKDSKAADQKKPKQKVKMVTTGEVCLAAGTAEATRGSWVLDSGATSHMTNDVTLLETLDTSCKESITVADGKRIKANGIGVGIFQGVNGEGNPMNIKLSQVYHVPALAGNLLSVSKITDQGFSVLFDKKSCKIQKDGVAYVVGERRGNLYHLKKRSEKMLLTTENHPKQCVHLWHRRLGHRSIEAIKKVVREGLGSGISMQECGVQSICGTCYEGKMARVPFPKASNSKSEVIGDLIHTDLAGPFEVSTPSGNRYSMVLVDDFSRYTVLYLLRCKSEAYEKIQQYVSMMQNQFGRKPKIFRADGGGEYSSGKLLKFLADNGILLQQTAPYSPQQNGAAERKNRSLGEMMRCLLTEASLEKKFWGEAITTSNYLQNILPTTAASVTPYELWHGRKPSYTHLRVFGSTAWVYIPSQKRKKLDRKAEKLVLVGYAEGRKAYRLLNVETNCITISRDVKFDESTKSGDRTKIEVGSNEVELRIKHNGPIIESDAEVSDADDEADNDDAASVASEGSFQGFPEQQVDIDRMSEADAEIASVPDEAAPGGAYVETPRRSQRSTKGIPPRRLFLCAENDELLEPRSFAEAMASPESDKWRSAMQEELQSIEDNETWDLVTLPAGRKPVGSKWVYKIKRGAQGEVTRFKARLVAQGYSQQYGTDYDQVFAPVVRQTTFRTLLAVAAKQNMKVRQYDVKTAFLYGTLEEEIYLRQPTGFTVRGHENKVYRLKKSLYGLKQAARSWNQKLHTELLRLGFQKCDADPCLYRKKEGNQWCYILVYVDDLIIASCNERIIEKTAEGLQKHFNISSMGDIRWYLGIEVERDEDGDFFLNQKQYIDEISRTNGLEDAKPSKIPIDSGYFKQEGGEQLPDNKNYQKLIGQLLYVSVNTRPDISAAVSILSRKTSCPTQNDWNELKRVTRYLKSTRDFKLRVSNNAKSDGLVGFSDADWAECREDRKSNTGFVMMFNGGTINWACRKQTCVSLSTAEAEFVALSEATQEFIWLKRLLADLNEKQNNPIIYEDNQSALKMLESEKFSNRTKHIATRFQFARDAKEKGELRFKYCPTEEMAADLLTKPIGGVRMAKLRAMCGLETTC